MGSSVAPLRMPRLLGCLRQRSQRPPVIALQLPNLHQSSIVSNASFYVSLPRQHFDTMPSLEATGLPESLQHTLAAECATACEVLLEALLRECLIREAAVLVSIDAAESAHPWEPPAIGLHIRRVAQLPARSRPYDNLLDDCAEIIDEGIPEGMHEVRVALHGGAPCQHARGLIREDGDVLAVAVAHPRVARPVCEEDVRILLPSLHMRTK